MVTIITYANICHWSRLKYCRVPRITHFHFYHSAYFPWGQLKAMLSFNIWWTWILFQAHKNKKYSWDLFMSLLCQNLKGEAIVLDIHTLQTPGEFIFSENTSYGKWLYLDTSAKGHLSSRVHTKTLFQASYSLSEIFLTEAWSYKVTNLAPTVCILSAP